MNEFSLLNRIKVTNPNANIDKDYGPYTSVSEAISSVVSSVRDKGKTVGIISNNEIVEYWWKYGIEDNDLIRKSSTTIVDTLEELSTLTIDSGEVYVTGDNIRYFKSTLKNSDVYDDGIKIIHSSASDYAWVRHTNSRILDIREVSSDEDSGGTLDDNRLRSALNAVNDREIYTKSNLNESNPHYDTIYIPEGIYVFNLKHTFRCNVISSPRAELRFDQLPITDSRWRDNKVFIQIGSSASDYSYETDLWEDQDDPFINHTDLHRWYDMDYIQRLGPINDVNTTSIFRYSTSTHSTTFLTSLNKLLVEDTQGHFQFINLVIDNPNKSCYGITERIQSTNKPILDNQKIKFLIVNYDTNGDPIDGRIFEKNYWDSNTDITIHDVDIVLGNQYRIDFRLADLDIRDYYGTDNGSIEIIESYPNRKCYVFWDSGLDYMYYLEPDCVTYDENYSIPRVIYSDLQTRTVLLDSSGRYFVSEPNNVSPYLRTKVRSRSENRVSELKGYNLEFPNILHIAGNKVFPLFPLFKDVETDYSVGMLINGLKSATVKCVDARSFSTYQHIRGGSEISSFVGVLGCTFYGGNCANNKKQIDIRPFRPNGLRTGGFVNSNRFVDYTMNLGANNFIKDTAYDTASIGINSIISLEDIYEQLPEALTTGDNAPYPSPVRLLCVKFESREVRLKEPSRLASSTFVKLIATVNYSMNTVSFNGEVVNRGWVGQGDSIYVTTSIHKDPILWGIVLTSTDPGQSTTLTIDNSGGVWDGTGTDVLVYFYETFDVTRIKPNYYLDLNNVEYNLNNTLEYRIDHVVELTDGSGEWVVITNWGLGDSIYGETRISQSRWIPESELNNPDLSVSVRYARLGSHPSHLDPTSIDFVRTVYGLINSIGNPQVGLGSPNGNGFYNCIFEEHSGLGWKHYDLVGTRYTMFINIRAEVTDNRLPIKEFTNGIYIDGCDKIEIIGGSFMDKSILKIDSRPLNLSKKSGSIQFKANNQQIIDFIDVEFDEINSTLLLPNYNVSKGNVFIDNVNWTFGSNSRVKLSQQIFEPLELIANITEEYDKQFVNVRYSKAILLTKTPKSYSTEIVNTNFINIEILPSDGVTFDAVNTHILSKGKITILNIGNNHYIISGDLGSPSQLSSLYNDMISGFGDTSITDSITDSQSIKADIVLRVLEGKGILDKISNLGIFGGLVEGISLIDWKNPSYRTKDFVLSTISIISNGTITELIFNSSFSSSSAANDFAVRLSSGGDITFGQTIGERDNCMVFTNSGQVPGVHIDYTNDDIFIPGQRYRVRFEIYFPSTNNLPINGYVVKTNDTRDGISFTNSMTPDTWHDILYTPNEGGSNGQAAGYLFDESGTLSIRPTVNGYTSLLGNDDSTGDILAIRNLTFIPISDSNETYNSWSDDGYESNGQGYISTKSDAIPDSGMTIFSYQSETSNSDAAPIVDDQGNELSIELVYLLNDSDEKLSYQDQVVFNGLIANTGFGIGSKIYFTDDEGSSKLGEVIGIQISRTTIFGDIDCHVLDMQGEIRLPGMNANFTMVQSSSNKVIFGMASSNNIRLYADTRTALVSIHNTALFDESGERLYINTELDPTLALTKRDLNTIEIFQGDTFTEYSQSFESNPTTNGDSITIFKSNDAIANGYKLGVWFLSTELTQEELLICRSLFETYYS